MCRVVSCNPNLKNIVLIHHAAIDSCTIEEAMAFRKRLREVGEDQFVTETIEARTISAKKLCTAFGISSPPPFEGLPDVGFKSHRVQ